MTVSYSSVVATSKFGVYFRLLLRWRGSIYKFIWREFAVFVALFYTVTFIYRVILNDYWKRYMEVLAKFCDESTDRIPVAFILGFYVSLVVGRFWEQLNTLPWPNRAAVYVASMIRGCDDKSRMYRRTIMRYFSAAYVLTMRSICPPVRQRFQTLGHLTAAGLITEPEQRILKAVSLPNRKFDIHSEKFRSKSLKDLYNIPKSGVEQPASFVRVEKSGAAAPAEEYDHDDEAAQNVYYVPLLWAADLVNKAREDTPARIKHNFAVKTLLKEINNYRGQCGTLYMFDWITVPLVYTQVVTIAVYTFFLCCLVGRQRFDQYVGDFYLPVFTFLEFLFIMGWLKVAENLLNPFGGDDADFEINPLIEDNLQAAFTIVDELCEFSPELEKDHFFNSMDVDIRYTPETRVFKVANYAEGSANKANRKLKTHHGLQPFEGSVKPLSPDDADHGNRTRPRPLYSTATRPHQSPSCDTDMTGLSDDTEPLLTHDEDRVPVVRDVSRHQQPIFRLNQAFLDQVHQELYELRMRPRELNVYNRNQFLNQLHSP